MADIKELAPEFSLLNAEDKEISLSDLLGDKYIFLYIYPTDEKFKCNRSECPFKENLEKIQQNDIIVVSISTDSVEEHRRFKSEHNITFELLSDPTMKVIKEYSAYEKVFVNGIEKEKIIPTAILINPKGYIVNIWKPIKIEQEIDDIISFIKNLKK